MRETPAFYTVVGVADLDNLETFVEVVYARQAEAWTVAVDQALVRFDTRQFLEQATEVATLMGVCVEPGARDLPTATGRDLKINPDPDTLYDLQVYIRTTPGETPDAPPVTSYHWYDDEAEAESEAFTTYVEALNDRYDTLVD